MARCARIHAGAPTGPGRQVIAVHVCRGCASRAWFWSHLPGVLVALTDYFFLGGGMCCVTQKSKNLAGFHRNR